MDYLRKYNDHSDYQADGNKPTPNVSYCVTQDEVHFNGPQMVITLNVTNTGSTDQNVWISFLLSTDVKVDGVSVDREENLVAFTPGDHVIEYFFEKSTVCPYFVFSDGYLYGMIDTVIFPEGITSIETVTRDESELPSISIGGQWHLPSTLQSISAGATCYGIYNVTQEDVAFLDSICTMAPTQDDPHPWSVTCGK